MKVRYLKDVTSPPARVGVINQIRDFEQRIGRQLIADGSATQDLEIPKACELNPVPVAAPPQSGGAKIEPTRDVELLIDITSPAEQAGKKGDVITIRTKIADQLVAAGYAKEIETKTKKKEKSKNAHKRTDTKS